MADHDAPGDDIRALLDREPIFHRREIVWDAESFDDATAPDFREIGASGRCYERAEVRATVLGRFAGTHGDSLPNGYEIRDAEVARLTDDVVQVRYTLVDPMRITRRSTLYRRRDGRWQAVFHQGTVVADA